MTADLVPLDAVYARAACNIRTDDPQIMAKARKVQEKYHAQGSSPLELRCRECSRVVNMKRPLFGDARHARCECGSSEMTVTALRLWMPESTGKGKV